MKFKFYSQFDKMDCAPTCLKMISEYYGKKISLDYLRDLCYMNQEGVSLMNLKKASEKLGFVTIAANANINALIKLNNFPCIAYWNQEHYVVLLSVKEKFISKLLSRKNANIIFEMADPAHGIVHVNFETFKRSWISTDDEKGTVLLLEPSDNFNSIKNAGEIQGKATDYSFILKYVSTYRKYFYQLLLGLISASAIALIFPFLSQLLIDLGVIKKNINYIYLILFSQLFLFIGNALINIVQSWLLLHVNARISLSILSNFLTKLLKLPIRFFDTKSIGDISQRIYDHHRIEGFLTGVLLSTLFSMINIIVSSIVLAYYDVKILTVFTIFSVAAVSWILIFSKKRKQLDYERFANSKENQNKLYELIYGMQEIKLYGSEVPKRLEWEKIQVNLFRLNIKSLSLEQYQRSGFLFISQLKNIVMSFLAAKGVIQGEFSLGVLLSISYIIGQTNGPLEQLVNFVKAAQDAKLSIDRMQEIYSKEDEGTGLQTNPSAFTKEDPFFLHKDLVLDNVSFQYEGPYSPFVIKDLSLRIPKGKIYAIVGASGSGKTTLLKLLLGFYSPTSGQILIGNTGLNEIIPSEWRAQCGTVMQDGYIFTDTISRNIAFDGKDICDEKLNKAVNISNIKEFINGLPLKYATKIGNDGIGISGGQRQRIFIARAVYKDPQYLFFDEATSALDANNETIIMNNLNRFFIKKTVIIIAHRLSTVKNADCIVVMDKGKIVETGNHEDLCSKKGYYYTLVKNQLELGS